MRPCPVCESDKRDTKFRQSFLVPDGWTLPSYVDWFVCRSCGMIYGDSPEMTQEAYNTYYQTKYGFGVEDEQSHKRQLALADWAKKQHEGNLLDYDALIVDFGGGEGVLTKKLRNYGFHNVINIEAGDGLPVNIDRLFAEHVLEHIYDLPITMQTIASCMKPRGLMVIDGPESGQIAVHHKTSMLDWHSKHINHFTMFNYLHLMHRYDFTNIFAATYEERNHNCMQFVFQKQNPDTFYDMSIQHITASLTDIVAKLDALEDKEVIVWGVGDLCLHALSLKMPNVRYFVDKDPAFRDTVIAGHPVFSFVQKNDLTPILIIATGQKQNILDNIRAERLSKNELIVL